MVEIDAEPIALGVPIEKSRACSILSGEKPMPGTMLAGENAACSTSAKKFSGLRFNSKKPTSISGKSAFGQTLVKSKGLKGNAFRLGVGHDLNEQGPARKIPLFDTLKKITLVCFTILSDQGFRLRITEARDACCVRK
jgi:hypothetical protein